MLYIFVLIGAPIIYINDKVRQRYFRVYKINWSLKTDFIICCYSPLKLF